MGKTGYYTHPVFQKHDMGEGHPECPQRLAAISDRLLANGVMDAMEERQAPMASPHDIELAHSRMHIAALRGMHDQLIEEVAVGGPSLAHLDPDTAMNAYTWQAAMTSAGAAIAATEAVLSGELENAFCAVRPPGHHASRNQAMGFCFVNNIALAAKYAIDRHGLKRVAIVDFDVHHGNGTEDIVAGDDRIMMLGFFQHPFYPNTGATPLGGNIFNTPLPAYTRGDAVRALVEDHWVPKLETFKPEIIFISAGFDAHRLDDMGQMGLVEQDYAYITGRLKDCAKRHAKGRIVSCLEGGYHLQALARSVEAHVRVLADIY
jgi:acetoin utilization deacetylase AcuC-like enzyme